MPVKYEGKIVFQTIDKIWGIQKMQFQLGTRWYTTEFWGTQISDKPMGS